MLPEGYARALGGLPFFWTLRAVMQDQMAKNAARSQIKVEVDAATTSGVYLSAIQ